jgi:hypothetical protein
MSDYNKPQDAPETMLAADGQTVLHRFKVDAVIFATDQASAQRRLDIANVFFDGAALREDPAKPQRAWYPVAVTRPKISTLQSAPHCRAHLEARSDCPDCERERNA